MDKVKKIKKEFDKHKKHHSSVGMANPEYSLWDEYSQIQIIVDSRPQTIYGSNLDKSISGKGWSWDADDEVLYLNNFSGSIYAYDIYLDLVVYPDGTIIVDDMDELEQAVTKNDISIEQYNKTLEAADKLKNTLLCDMQKYNKFVKNRLQDVRNKYDGYIYLIAQH